MASFVSELSSGGTVPDTELNANRSAVRWVSEPSEPGSVPLRSLPDRFSSESNSEVAIPQPRKL